MLSITFLNHCTVHAVDHTLRWLSVIRALQHVLTAPSVSVDYGFPAALPVFEPTTSLHVACLSKIPQVEDQNLMSKCYQRVFLLAMLFD